MLIVSLHFFTALIRCHRMLSELEAGVDRTENKLGGAMKKMKKFIQDTEGTYPNVAVILSSCCNSSSKPDTKSGWCIIILIVVLCCLLLAVVLL